MKLCCIFKLNLRKKQLFPLLFTVYSVTSNLKQRFHDQPPSDRQSDLCFPQSCSAIHKCYVESNRELSMPSIKVCILITQQWDPIISPLLKGLTIRIMFIPTATSLQE